MNRSAIEGVIMRSVQAAEDVRGWLIELFRQDEMSKELFPVMSYISMTKPGLSRGPHEHKEQSDYFCFVGPSSFRLYLWDNRSHSPSHGKHEKFEVGESNRTSIVIPPGVVHAYKNIGRVDGLVINSPNRLYAGKNKRDSVDEIRHESKVDSPFKITD